MLPCQPLYLMSAFPDRGLARAACAVGVEFRSCEHEGSVYAKACDETREMWRGWGSVSDYAVAGGRRGAGGSGASDRRQPAVQGQVRHAEGLAPVVPPTRAEEPYSHPEAESSVAAGAESAPVPAVDLVQRDSWRQTLGVPATMDRAREAAGSSRPKGEVLGMGVG